MSIKIKLPFSGQAARYLGTTVQHRPNVSSLKTRRFPDGIVRTRRRGVGNLVPSRCRKKVSRCSCRRVPQLTHRPCCFVRMHTREKAHAYVCNIEHILLQEYCGMTRTSTPMNTSASLALHSLCASQSTWQRNDRLHQNARMHSLTTNFTVIVFFMILSFLFIFYKNFYK